MIYCNVNVNDNLIVIVYIIVGDLNTLYLNTNTTKGLIVQYYICWHV